MPVASFLQYTLQAQNSSASTSRTFLALFAAAFLRSGPVTFA